MSTETETELTIDEKIENTKQSVKEHAMTSMAYASIVVFSLALIGVYDGSVFFVPIMYLVFAIGGMVATGIFVSRLISQHCAFHELLAEKHAH